MKLAIFFHLYVYNFIMHMLKLVTLDALSHTIHRSAMTRQWMWEGLASDL